MVSETAEPVIVSACGVPRRSAARATPARSASARLQLDAPDHLRGRVLSLYYYAWNGLAPLGGVIIGWLSATGGTELAFAVAGTAGLVMAASGAFALRRPRPVPIAEESAEPSEELAAA